jgi:hypothetical protein
MSIHEVLVNHALDNEDELFDGDKEELAGMSGAIGCMVDEMFEKAMREAAMVGLEALNKVGGPDEASPEEFAESVESSLKDKPHYLKARKQIKFLARFAKAIAMSVVSKNISEHKEENIRNN